LIEDATSMRSWIKKHPLSSYFFAAYAISWSIAVPLALQAQGLLAVRLPWSLHYLTAFGPAVAGILIMRLSRESAGAVRSSHRMKIRRSAAWWLVGFGSPFLLFLIAELTARMFGHSEPISSALGHVSFLPDLGMAAWGLWFLTSGCGEELGWRGFALPRLQQRHSAMTSSLLIAIGWAGWHIPAFFYLPGYAAIGPRVLPGFFLGLFAGAIVLTWLYNKSGGSVFAAALWHASFNFVTASPTGGLIAAVTSSLVVVWAVAVAWRYDWATLASRSGKTKISKTRRPDQPRLGDGLAQATD